MFYVLKNLFERYRRIAHVVNENGILEPNTVSLERPVMRGELARALERGRMNVDLVARLLL